MMWGLEGGSGEVRGWYEGATRCGGSRGVRVRFAGGTRELHDMGARGGFGSHSNMT